LITNTSFKIKYLIITFNQIQKQKFRLIP